VASYWVIDLDVPSITAWTLRGGRYDDEVVAIGDAPFVAAAPYDVRLVPSSLVD
jgi:hypothetical protein